MGLGRTGHALACNYAEIKPDFICLSKGLTAGFLPMSVVLTSTSLYNLFYRDDKAMKNSVMVMRFFSMWFEQELCFDP
jgi:adenosylmethionine-8-amino-7-oxononanoate aminotransferase